MVRMSSMPAPSGAGADQPRRRCWRRDQRDADPCAQPSHRLDAADRHAGSVVHLRPPGLMQPAVRQAQAAIRPCHHLRSWEFLRSGTGDMALILAGLAWPLVPYLDGRHVPSPSASAAGLDLPGACRGRRAAAQHDRGRADGGRLCGGAAGGAGDDGAAGADAPGAPDSMSLIHAPTRLSIVALLAASQWAESRPEDAASKSSGPRPSPCH